MVFRWRRFAGEREGDESFSLLCLPFSQRTLEQGGLKVIAAAIIAAD
jgi:hypothetical protein